MIGHTPGDPRMNIFGWRFFEHYRDNNHVFSDLFGISPASFQVTGDGLEPEAVEGEYVVGTFFTALGVQPAIGRLIGAQDNQVSGGDPAVAVLSWAHWQTRFNRDAAILGRQIVLNGVPARVIGVAPREFFGLRVGFSPDVWVPAAMETLIQRPSRRATGELPLGLMARLKPGVSIEQARAEMRVLDRFRVEGLATGSKNPVWRQASIDVEPAGAGLSRLRDHLATPLLSLTAIVALLLLLTCTNVAGMMVARGASRQREMATRVALGADRVRLVRQVLTESLLLSTAGGLLGLFLAYFGAGALVRLWLLNVDVRARGPGTLELNVHPDPQVLLFAAGLALLTGVLAGLFPAWNAFAHASATSLREIGVAGETRSRRLLAQSLVVAQVTVSLVLLTAAGIFAGHVSSLKRDPGFERDSVLLVTLDPARSGYQREQLSNLYRGLLEQLEAIPGVRSVTVSALTPTARGGAARFATVEGFEEKPEDRRYLSLNWVGPRYLETLGTPLLAGRDFQFQDENRPRVAIVNRAMARYYFGDDTAIGKRFTFDGQQGTYEIVGVAGDAKSSDLREAPPRTIYLHAFQEERGRVSQFALRTDLAPARIVDQVRAIVRDTLKTVPVARVTTLAEQVNESIAQERLMATLSTGFGLLGALLAALGLYGLLAYTVARRPRRSAFGWPWGRRAAT